MHHANRSISTAALVAVLLLLGALTARDAGAGLTVHACTSCEFDAGGTGVALKNHVRGQLLAGHSVAVVTMDFGVNNASQRVESAVVDEIAASVATTVNLPGGSYELSVSSIKNGTQKLFVFRIKPPAGYDHQEEAIAIDLALMPSLHYILADILGVIVGLGAEYDEGILSFQMHVYWNMVLEKELATRLRLACQVTNKGPADECRRVPIAMWLHSDENAYSGKQQTDSTRAAARTRASILLKEMIHLSDAVFTVSTPSRDLVLSETDTVRQRLGKTDDLPASTSGPYFSVAPYDPKHKLLPVPFYVGLPELCDPLRKVDDAYGCKRAHQKFALPVFNAAKPMARPDLPRDKLRAEVLAYLREEDADARQQVADINDDLGRKFRTSLMKIDVKDLIVLSIGRINASKNPKVLVENWGKVAAATGDRAHLIIAGPPETTEASKQYFLELWAAIEKANQGRPRPLVHYVGRIPSDRTAKLYAMADVFVSPSTAETQGMTVLEAMAVGTPVVANATVPSYREFVADPTIDRAAPHDADGHGNGLLADPGTADFYDKIIRILTTPALAEKLSVRGQRTYQSYTIESIAVRTNWAMGAVYQRVNGTPLQLPLIDQTPIPAWPAILK